MKIGKVILIGSAVLVSIVLVGNYLLQQKLRRVDFTPLARLVEARLGEAVTLPALTQVSVTEGNALFNTYSHSLQIAEYMINHESGSRPLILSTKVAGLDTEVRMDAWGHPFCILGNPAGVGVMSAGPNGSWSDDCREAAAVSKDMPGLKTGRLYQYPSGVLVLTLAKTPSS